MNDDEETLMQKLVVAIMFTAAIMLLCIAPDLMR